MRLVDTLESVTDTGWSVCTFSASVGGECDPIVMCWISSWNGRHRDLQSRFIASQRSNRTASWQMQKLCSNLMLTFNMTRTLLQWLLTKFLAIAEIMPKSNGQSLKIEDFQYHEIINTVNFYEYISNGRNRNVCWLHFSLKLVNLFKTTKQLIGWTLWSNFNSDLSFEKYTYFAQFFLPAFLV